MEYSWMQPEASRIVDRIREQEMQRLRRDNALLKETLREAQRALGRDWR